MPYFTGKSYQMKNMMLFFLLALASMDLRAQGVFANQTNSALEKVIQDYPNRFKNIQGAVIIRNNKATDYESSIKIPGSLSCVVTRWGPGKEVLSWKAELYEFKEFDDAKMKYKELYSQIKNTIIKIEGEKPYILNGQYKTPDQNKRFQATVFSMLPSTGEMQKVKVEILMQYQNSFWKISIVVYDRSGNEDQITREQ